ncbi:hypothetical protein [Gordonia sp. OPL2]|uniref:hypothetical protein n=1 Tax=Gordonia sp. OPL2 TaxID=2486274 RepID=UPI0016561EEF|nr:hypothetical protein [Gordonia sp. OPL2]
MIVAPLARLIAPKLGLDPEDFDTIEEIEDFLNPWQDLFGADFGDLRDAFEGDYTGTDPTLLAIQSLTTGKWVDLDNIVDNINNAIAGGVAAGTGAVAGVFNTVANIFGIADAAQKTAMAAQQQLQDIANTTPEGGFSWSTIFAGADGSALNSSDWPAGSSDLVIRGDNGYVGIASGAGNGTYYRQCAYSFATDTQATSMVLGTRPALAPGYDTGMTLRCNADMTAGAYCTVDREMVSVGRFTRSGSTWTFTPFSTQAVAINQGDIIRFRASGDNYYVQVNGTTKLSVTDSGATVAKGASYRRSGFLEQRGTQIFSVDSYRIASFAMADWSAPGAGLTTAAWRVRRSNTAEVTITAGTNVRDVMPSGFYESSDLANNVTVTDLGLGRITIAEAGFYEIAASSVYRTNFSNLSDAYRPTQWVLYVDGTPVAGPIHSGASTTVYLAAGQVVQPGYVAAWPGSYSSTADNPTIASSTINRIGGGPSASFTGRKVA